MGGSRILRSPWLRSGRAIAVFRLLLACGFLASLWFDPTQPIRQETLADLALALYLTWSAALLVVAWTSWRLDTMLAMPALLLDVAVFVAGLYFTESENSTFASPYVAGFVFIVFSTLLRRGQRWALVMGAVLALLYLIDCQVLEALGIGIDMLRMLRRLVYMALIALVFIWISPGAGALPAVGFSPPAEARTPGTLLRAALNHAMRVTGATGGAIAWGETDGPPCELIEQRDGKVTASDPGPEGIELFTSPLAGRGAELWSPKAACALTLSEKGSMVLEHNVRPGPLLDCSGGEDAIVVPLESSGVEARLVLWGIAGVCGDDLRLVERIRREIEGTLDRNHIMVLQEREMAARLRGALARDLHDGVSQTLAGALLRLEGLRGAIRGGKDPFGNIDDARASLRAEQANVREMIRQLKQGESLPMETEIPGELAQWLETAGAVWGVAVNCDPSSGPIRVKVLVAFELRQLLREAIANAARHGQCRRVDISFDHGPGASLILVVEDDGSGLPAGTVPRSIAERLAVLGGRLETGRATIGGARLTLSIPKAVEP